MLGYVYILTNKLHPGLVKIGYTNTTPEDRLKSINSATGLVQKFELYYSFELENAQHLEQIIHNRLSDYRLKSNKEFFTLTPNLAKIKIEQIIKGSYKRTTYSKDEFALITSAKDVGELIRKHRKKAGITQMDLAGLAGTGNRFIVDLEAGKETIQLGLAIKIMTFLNLKLGMKDVDE